MPPAKPAYTSCLGPHCDCNSSMRALAISCLLESEPLGIPGEQSRDDSSFLFYSPPLWFRIRELVLGRG